ncbi:MAG: hypothetical protein LLG16_00990 [Euryarchaeota archaeon]|nr:hypothetical protein [Euryarchaeota archaeon]
MFKVLVSARVFPTEDPEKVREAITNLFPAEDVTILGEEMVAKPTDIERFMMTIRQMRILDAVRGRMRHGVIGNSTTFQLNKQAAYAGKVSAAEGVPPLGNITVIIESDDIEKTIDQIAPMTVNGEVVE